jgi:hypothetical protein
VPSKALRCPSQAACARHKVDQHSLTNWWPLVSPISGLFSRFLHRSLNQRSSWYSRVSLDPRAISKLQFWRHHLDQFQAHDIWRRFSLLRVVYYDAGGQGWGGHLQIGSAHHEEHAVTSSTWRKLTALLCLLRAFDKLLSDCTIIARGDAQNVFWILSKGGSPEKHIQAVCLDIIWLCVERRIDPWAEWIPRDENQLADYLSKVWDSDDFRLSTEAFASISSCFGSSSVDRFASQHNTKLPRFNAFYWCPQAEACNEFTQDWGADGRSYCFPPPHLVARTLQHARACRARITLVVLGWRTVPWWPLLCGSVKSDRGFTPFVWGQLFFPQSRRISVPSLASKDQFCGWQCSAALQCICSRRGFYCQ